MSKTAEFENKILRYDEQDNWVAHIFHVVGMELALNHEVFPFWHMSGIKFQEVNQHPGGSLT